MHSVCVCARVYTCKAPCIKYVQKLSICHIGTVGTVRRFSENVIENRESQLKKVMKADWISHRHNFQLSVTQGLLLHGTKSSLKV